MNQICGLNDDELAPGLLVGGKFRIVSSMAEGGMGRIYVATQEPLGRKVALKVLKSDRTFSGKGDTTGPFQKRFIREASILSQIRSRYVVTLYDYGCMQEGDINQFFIAMELLEGESLKTRLGKGTLPLRDLFRFFNHIGKGLREAHKRDVIHRDLKPANVMIVPEEDGCEVAKLVDFGIGKVISAQDEQDLTADGSFVGSPRYMAPDSILHGQIDHHADIYSLGVMLYESLCGAVPFDGKSSLQTVMAHCHSPVPSMESRAPGVHVPECLEALAMKCLAKTPADRPGSAVEFIDLLAVCQATLSNSVGSISDSQPSIRTANIPRPPQLTPDITTGGSATSAGHDAPQRSSGRMWTTIGIVSAGLVVLAVGAAFLLKKPQEVVTPVIAVSASPPAQVRDRSSAGNPAHSAKSEPQRFTLSISSVPSAAEVYDGSQRLGTTPLQFDVERDSVASAPRTFILRHAGYMPQILEQRDSKVAVSAIVTLVPVPQGTPLVPRNVSPAPPKPKPPQDTTPEPPRNLDIPTSR